MGYALQHLEEKLKRTYNNISTLEDDKEHFENELKEAKENLTQAYTNAKDLELTIDKLKGETK